MIFDKKEEKREKLREWRKKNPDKVKESNQKRKAKMAEYWKKKYQENPEKFLEAQRKYRKTHPEKTKELRQRSLKKHYQNHKEYYKNNAKKQALLKPDWYVIGKRKQQSKRRRELGYNPLNQYFKGSDAHHIDYTNIIYIPTKLHESIDHSQLDEISMQRINIIAWTFMECDLY